MFWQMKVYSRKCFKEEKVNFSSPYDKKKKPQEGLGNFKRSKTQNEEYCSTKLWPKNTVFLTSKIIGVLLYNIKWVFSVLFFFLQN